MGCAAKEGCELGSCLTNLDPPFPSIIAGWGGIITVKRNPHVSTFSSILASFNCLSVYRSKSTNIKCLWRILFFFPLYLFIYLEAKYFTILYWFCLEGK